LAKTTLIGASALYYWYLVTEGQITPLFLVSLLYMNVLFIYNTKVKGQVIDENGDFLLKTFKITLFLVFAWSLNFWNDVELRNKYPGLIYVPEPWSVYSLHYSNYFNLFKQQ
jgi:ceroid-lipofuscinosis neuronal protein 6